MLLFKKQVGSVFMHTERYPNGMMFSGKKPVTKKKNLKYNLVHGKIIQHV